VRRAILSFSVLLFASVRAEAQGLLIEASGGYYGMTGAPNSTKAVFGSSGGPTVGLNVGYALDNNFFFSAGGGYFSRDGERVFLASRSSTVFKLGHPLALRLIPLQATVGYRFAPRAPVPARGRRPAAPQRLLTPYVGFGGGVLSYREESTVGGVTETDSRSKPSGHALAGLEIGRSRLRFAVEARYTLVPDSLGVGGVSKVYGENDIGGFTLSGKLVFLSGAKEKRRAPPPGRRWH
jgi:hypothetical protein